MAPSHVLVALDGSPLSEAALEYALETFDCDVTVLNVVTPIEAGMALRRRPSAPAFLFSSAYGVLPDLDPAWEAYLPRGR